MKIKIIILLIHCLFLTSCKADNPSLNFSAPIQIVDNRPFVKVNIKGKAFHFVIDTGGFNSIETEIAQELGLDLRNKFQMPGAGEKTVDAWTTVIDTFSIGENKFQNRRFYTLPLKTIKENLKLPFLDGIIGYDFFSDSILQLDYPNKQVNFLNKFAGQNGMSFAIYGSHIPKLKVEIDGIESEFVIDTGDRSQLTLGQNFSRAVLAKNQYELSEEKVTGYGLGGAIMARTFELKSLKFGTTEAKSILTRIPNLKGGVFAQSDFNGSIGSGLLKNYKITLDYQNKLLFVE